MAPEIPQVHPVTDQQVIGSLIRGLELIRDMPTFVVDLHRAVALRALSDYVADQVRQATTESFDHRNN